MTRTPLGSFVIVNNNEYIVIRILYNALVIVEYVSNRRFSELNVEMLVRYDGRDL